MSGTYKHILVRYTAVYSAFIIYQVQVLCGETTQDALKKDAKSGIHEIEQEGHALRESNLRPRSLSTKYILSTRCTA